MSEQRNFEPSQPRRAAAGASGYGSCVGTLQAIYLRPAARLPVKSVESATAITATGLDGDHAVAGKRQITLLSIEAWRTACADLGHDIDPAVRRANLLVEGVDLANSIGSTIQVGPVVIDITGETRPCELLDANGNVGLCAALRDDLRAGVHGTIREGGALAIGDACSIQSK